LYAVIVEYLMLYGLLLNLFIEFMLNKKAYVSNKRIAYIEACDTRMLCV